MLALLSHICNAKSQKRARDTAKAVPTYSHRSSVVMFTQQPLQCWNFPCTCLFLFGPSFSGLISTAHRPQDKPVPLIERLACILHPMPCASLWMTAVTHCAQPAKIMPPVLSPLFPFPWQTKTDVSLLKWREHSHSYSCLLQKFPHLPSNSRCILISLQISSVTGCNFSFNQIVLWFSLKANASVSRKLCCWNLSSVSFHFSFSLPCTSALLLLCHVRVCAI